MNKKISVIFVEIHHLVITIIYENCKNKTIVAVNEPSGASRQKHAAVRRLQIANATIHYTPASTHKKEHRLLSMLFFPLISDFL
ncbi:MAG: hypothetical protein KHX20_10560, partial [Megasphaera sp.]|nr:hypothetical protein [Megasphaera sp.]